MIQESYSKRYDTTGKVDERFPSLSGRLALRLAPANATQVQQRQAQGTRRLAIGVVLSGGQAPGGHNVILGILDYLNEHCPGSKLYGFLNGCKGIVQCKYKELDAEDLVCHRVRGDVCVYLF